MLLAFAFFFFWFATILGLLISIPFPEKIKQKHSILRISPANKFRALILVSIFYFVGYVLQWIDNSYQSIEIGRLNNQIVQLRDQITSQSKKIDLQTNLIKKLIEGNQHVTQQLDDIKKSLPSPVIVNRELRSTNNQTHFNLDQKIQLLTQYSLAQEAYEKQNYMEATKSFQNLINQAPLSSFYFALAESYARLSQYDLARENYLMAISIAKEQKNPTILVYALKGIADMAIDTGYFKDAEDSLSQALDISYKIGDQELEMNVLMSLGNAYDSLSQVDISSNYYQKAYSIAKIIGNKHLEGIILGNMGLSEARKRNYSEAKNNLEKALEILDQFADKENEERFTGEMGDIYKRSGRSEDMPYAMEYLNKALILAKNMGDLNGVGTWLSNLGSAYRISKNYPKAIDLYNQSLEIARKIGDKRGEAVRLGNLGRVYIESGSIGRGMELIQESIEACSQINDILNVFINTYYIARVYFKIKKYDLALEYFKKAYALGKQLPHGYGMEVTDSQNMIYELEKVKANR